MLPPKERQTILVFAAKIIAFWLTHMISFDQGGMQRNGF